MYYEIWFLNSELDLWVKRLIIPMSYWLAVKIRGRKIDYIIDYLFATASFEKESNSMRRWRKKFLQQISKEL